ncbi:MAG: hypothetical protein R6W99_03740 [Clostridia bacterium]
MNKDIRILRELAAVISEISSMDAMDERRRLWASHNALKKVRTPIYIRDGQWSSEIIEPLCECEDDLFRQTELYLRKMKYQFEVGDDFVIENHIKFPAVHVLPGYGPWGMVPRMDMSGAEGGCNKIHAALDDIADLSAMKTPEHRIDERQTALNHERLSDAVGDILPVLVERTPYWSRWGGDISTHLGYLLGIDGLMWAIYDHPDDLHRLVAFMRDGILKAHAEAEAAGDFTLLSHENQSMPYIEGLAGPDGGAVQTDRSRLWVFYAAQEFALISPEHHKEFLLDYQIPIIEKFAYSSYGCWEDLTRKIDMLREIKNLRRIAVSPFSDERACAEQMGGDYIASWRPSPSTTVCLGFDEENIRGILMKAKKAFEDNGCPYDICLKDVHTIGRDYNRLIDFTRIAREVVES